MPAARSTKSIADKLQMKGNVQKMILGNGMRFIRTMVNLFLGSAGLICILSWRAIGAVHAEPGAGNQSTHKSFSASAWRQAKSGAEWTRVELASDFYKEYKPNGMERKKVIELLGEPTVSTEHSPRATNRTTTDMYLLSSKNKESLRINYDSSDKVSGVMFEGPCQTWIDLRPQSVNGPILNADTLNKALSGGAAQGSIGSLEKLLGKPHVQKTTKSLVGGQYWANFNYLWRLSADGRKVFGVYGHKPLRDFNPCDIEKELALGEFIQTSSPDCPFVSLTDEALESVPPLPPTNAKK